MTTMKWICWLLFACICLAEARYKMRRPLGPPLPPPPPKMLVKKSWPISHRISMGSPMYIAGNFPPKRITHNIKSPNYRFRRPTVINIMPTMWKNPTPVRTVMNNHVVLPNRPPVKEFHSMNKVPEYSPEYRPQTSVLPATHRGGIDDDKGPIHTIPAPNLSPLDRPYNAEINTNDNYRRQHTAETSNTPNVHGPLLPNFDLSTIGTSSATQRTVTSPTPTQHQYEVTESNDVTQKEYHTVMPTFLPPEFDVTRLTNLVNPDLQSNEVFLNHPGPNIGLIGSNLQFGQPNPAMQANLHSSLHVGFPGTASQGPYMPNQQIPELHVGHPAPAGPPLSATQLYDLLNSFPQQLADQYQSAQHPQLQQHILQQHLGQIYQPGVVRFPQPQMHMFNYEEQDNQGQQQQQQAVFINPEYIEGKVNTDYKVGAEPSAETEERGVDDQQLTYIPDGTEHVENNIEYEENNHKGQTTYFNKVTNNGGLTTQFYTTLPNREAAEKLAALAAAGNVNSHLLGKLRQQQKENVQSDEAMPPNHKKDVYEVDAQQNDNRKYREGPQYEENNRFGQSQIQRQKNSSEGTYMQGNNTSLRIMVPDESDYVSDDGQHNSRETESDEVDYEYESDETDSNSQSQTPYEPSVTEFGTRIRSKTTS